LRWPIRYDEVTMSLGSFPAPKALALTVVVDVIEIVFPGVYLMALVRVGSSLPKT